jgi:hypothetical protein
VAYCTTADVSTGNIPLPTYIDKQKFVDDAADEIDSKIGFVYQTPLDITDSPSNLLVRPARLLLKRLNANLATGRLILALDAAGEDDKLHAYGWSLVREVTAALNNIADGDIALDGAPLVDPTANSAKAAMIFNVDPESNVEAFYDRIANPSYFYGVLGPFIGSDRGIVS